MQSKSSKTLKTTNSEGRSAYAPSVVFGAHGQRPMSLGTKLSKPRKLLKLPRRLLLQLWQLVLFQDPYDATDTSASSPQVFSINEGEAPAHNGGPFIRIGRLFPAIRYELTSAQAGPTEQPPDSSQMEAFTSTLVDAGTQTDEAINLEARPRVESKSPPIEERHPVLLSICYYPGQHTVPSYSNDHITNEIAIAAHAGTKRVQNENVEHNASHHIMLSPEPLDAEPVIVEPSAESSDAGTQVDVKDNTGLVVEDREAGASGDDPIILDSDPMGAGIDFSREGTGTLTDPIVLDPDVIGASDIFTRELASRDTGSPVDLTDDLDDTNEPLNIDDDSVLTKEWLVPRTVWDRAYRRWARVVNSWRLEKKRLPRPFMKKMDECEEYTKERGDLPAEKGWDIYRSWALCKILDFPDINGQREKKALEHFETALEQIKRAIAKEVYG
ncbi:hypothetical protein DM02DRAFT_276212 [Periconia macrospinosa]|uniref:Uncharacterized protein n=1 Tax=Periconia macrospinosa TaxID=97972 RepID=A0A2V1D365_9PLEO|nr:hypothetical protein DM02DRAFT_276212 [Periconia macrospinosa]